MTVFVSPSRPELCRLLAGSKSSLPGPHIFTPEKVFAPALGHLSFSGINAQRREVNDHLPCTVLGGVISGAKYQETLEGMISR